MAWRSTRVLVGAVVAVAVLLILVDMRGTGPTDALRGVGGAVAGPPERALSWVRTQAGQRLGGSAADQERITVLEDQLAQARAAAGAAAAGELAADQTKELAASAPAKGYATVAARVVSATAAQDPVRAVAVSAGSGQQVRPGLAVVAADGLAGIVDSVSPQVSTVRLVVDPATEVAARVASSGEIGVFRGTGSAGRFELLDPLGAMAAGDLIITLGTPSRDLPAGLPLGRVTAVSGSAADLTRAAEVAPAVDDSTLDRVLVLVPEARGEGAS